MYYDTNATVPSTYYSQTFTSPKPARPWSIYYLDYISGTWNYSLDGGGDNRSPTPTPGVRRPGQAHPAHRPLQRHPHLSIGKQSAGELLHAAGRGHLPHRARRRRTLDRALPCRQP